MIESGQQIVSRFRTVARISAQMKIQIYSKKLKLILTDSKFKILHSKLSVAMFQSCSKDMFTWSFVQFIF